MLLEDFDEVIDKAIAAAKSMAVLWPSDFFTERESFA